MSGLSVVIPSKTASNLLACISAVRKNEPGVTIHVIDDGLDGHIARMDSDRGALKFHHGISPFIFARNVNLGIQAAGKDDVVLLNDDAILESRGGFGYMQIIAQNNSEVALVSATTNVAGNPAQHRQTDTHWRLLEGNTPGNSFPTVAFICVLIPRRTINAIGLLDERFAPGCFEDNDYCRRVVQAGLKIAIADSCYVDHGSLRSTFRGEPRAAADLGPARQIYLDKWKTM